MWPVVQFTRCMKDMICLCNSICDGAPAVRGNHVHSVSHLAAQVCATINPGKTQVTYTVLVKGVEQEVYDNIQKYIPGQLMASGEMLDGQVVSVEPRAHEQTVTVDTTDGTLEIPVDEGTIDLLFTIECNVVNPITTEIGTQEVRVGKTHTVKTDKFELMNGVILDCEWGDGAAAADAQ